MALAARVLRGVGVRGRRRAGLGPHDRVGAGVRGGPGRWSPRSPRPYGDEVDLVGEGALGVALPARPGSTRSPRRWTARSPTGSSVLTVEQAKGLEFDGVVVVEPAAIAADSPAAPTTSTSRSPGRPSACTSCTPAATARLRAESPLARPASAPPGQSTGGGPLPSVDVHRSHPSPVSTARTLGGMDEVGSGFGNPERALRAGAGAARAGSAGARACADGLRRRRQREPARPRAPARRSARRTVATFDVDQLLDYRGRRPAMLFVEDHWERYEQPELVLRVLRDATGTQFLLLDGPEPDVQWERFTAAVDRADRAVRRAGHGRAERDPDGGAAHPADRGDRARHAARADRGLRAVAAAGAGARQRGHLLEYRLGQAGRDAIGFAVHVPHYLAQAEYPAAAEKLLRWVSGATGLRCRPASCTRPRRRCGPTIDGQVGAAEEAAAWSGRSRSSTTRHRGRAATNLLADRPARCRPPTSSAPSWSGSWPSRPTDPTSSSGRARQGRRRPHCASPDACGRRGGSTSEGVPVVPGAPRFPQQHPHPASRADRGGRRSPQLACPVGAITACVRRPAVSSLPART